MAFQRFIGPRHPVRLGYHYARALLAALLYRFPARRLTIIGITGSDGKTTTVEMTAHILRSSGIKCGALSTACFRVNEEVTWNATQKTSPSPFLIQRFLRRLVREGCTHAVIEYSSHGLVQHRTDFTWPAVAAITNLTPEHLDYHGSMERYKEDKAKLFRMLRGKGTKVLHVEDQTFEDYKVIPSGRTICYSSKGIVTLSSGIVTLSSDEGRQCNPGETYLWLSDIQATADGSKAMFHFASKESHGSSGLTMTSPLHLPIPGAFNLENALCAIASCYAAGIDILASARALSAFTGAPGRFEVIEAGQPFTVIVDFTVTPNAYRKTLIAARSLVGPNGRLLVLCGSCGDRMPQKRPEIGRICSELADLVVVTNEDPYSEDPEKIIDEVWSGIPASALAQAHRISDRRKAIEFILREGHSGLPTEAPKGAKVGDVVLLCGKGADTTMMTAAGQIPWDERGIVREIFSLSA